MENSAKDSNECQVKISVKDDAIEIMKENCRFFRDGELAYAVYRINNHYESAWIESRQFKKLIGYFYYEKRGKYLNENQIRETIHVLNSIASYEGTEVNVYGRMASLKDHIIINTGWPEWQYIYVRPGGWDIVESNECGAGGAKIHTLGKKPPLFLRPVGMKELPFPEKRETALDELRTLLGFGDNEAQWILVLSFLIHCYISRGALVILVVLGEAGSGKTFFTKIAKSIIDPHVVDVAKIPRDERDIFTAAGVSWLLCYDNFSRVSDDLSNLFCQISTGSGTIERLYFTNGEAFIRTIQRPMICNGINEFFTKPDLLQRSLVLNFKRIEDNKRRTEADLWEDYYKIEAGVFYEILELLSRVLAILPETHPDKLTRMADFCEIGEATCLSLGYDPGYFMAAYEQNLKDASMITLESNIIYPVIQKMVEVEDFYGSMSELLKKLESIDDETARSKHWPKDATRLSHRIRELAQIMRTEGYKIEYGRRNRSNWVSIGKNRDFPQAKEISSTSSTATRDKFKGDITSPGDPVIWGTI